MTVVTKLSIIVTVAMTLLLALGDGYLVSVARVGTNGRRRRSSKGTLLTSMRKYMSARTDGLITVAMLTMALVLVGTPYSASAQPSVHGSPYPTASTTLRLIATYPHGLTARGEQVLADGGTDVVMLLEEDAPTGGCIHDQLADLDLKTGKLRLGPVVTCFAWLFRSGTGQVYMTRPYHRGTELLRLDTRLIPVRVAVVGFAPAGFSVGAPVLGTDEMWLALAGRVALFELTTGKILRSLRLPTYVSGRPQGVALAGSGGPLYLTFSRRQPPACWTCAVLAEVEPSTGRVLLRRSLDSLGGKPVATNEGVFVGVYSGGTGAYASVYSAHGLRLLSGRGFGGTQPLWLTATGEVVWWSGEPPQGTNIFCGWITRQGSLGYIALQFKRWPYVWGNPVGIELSTGDLLLAGTAATNKIGESGLFAISTPRQCKVHM